MSIVNQSLNLEASSALTVRNMLRAYKVHSSQDFSSHYDTEIAMGDAHDSDFTDSQEIRNTSFQELCQVAAALSKSPLISNKRLNSDQRQEIAKKQLKKIVPALAKKSRGRL